MTVDAGSQLGMRDGDEGLFAVARRVARLVTLGLTIGVGIALALPGCMPKPPSSDAMPSIVIRPGAAERIALMDAYRLNDDIRKRMMARPRVWVEEVSEEEIPEDAATVEAASVEAASVAEPPASAASAR